MVAFLFALQLGPGGTPTPNQAPVVPPPPRARPEAAAPAAPSRQAAPAMDGLTEGRYRACVARVRENPEQAIQAASTWRVDGGGIYARLCLGLAYVALERWGPAATVYEQAAAEAQNAGDIRRADFLVQAGNAWIAAGQPTRAVLALDAALATTNLTDELRGEVHLDRARAMVALNNLAAARQDIDRAGSLVPGDPMVWYLSAELARRESNLARAETDIQRAMSLAGDNPDIVLLAGTIAGQRGDRARAEALYRRVAQQAPNTDAGRAAAASLAAGPSPAPPAQSPVQPR
ncbi:MAG: tetratricopeptide repeat protein [Sphingosinicella sp.]